MKRADLIILISNGKFDDMLDVLARAIHERARQVREARAATAYAELDVDDKIRLVNIKPKYLVGQRATITGKSLGPKGYIFRATLDFGRIKRYGPEINVPASCVEAA